MVKDGEVGAHAFAGGRGFVPAAASTVVEPVGAGDAFAAGYLAADLAGRPPPPRCRAGTASRARALATTGDF